MARILLVFTSLIVLTACNNRTGKTNVTNFNSLAERYVRLGLLIGQYDGSFVDAYYGPDSLKPAVKPMGSFPKDSLLTEVNKLVADIRQYDPGTPDNDSVLTRSNWMITQLKAFSRRIKWFAGEETDFDTEARELFGAVPPSYPESDYKGLVSQLDSLLPGSGSIPARVQALSKKFIIPVSKVDTVFKAAYAEARKITSAYLSYPVEESFVFEYVNNKPWSGYNWYKGNYKSVIQQNMDLPIQIERAIDLACHEGYPGHHVYNMLLEKNLYHDKGWVEISLYPLFSPQSLIAEGSANYGIEMAFPGREKIEFTKEVLIPLAGLDTAGLDLYFKMQDIRRQLNYARNEVARGMLNKTMDRREAMRWLTEYFLASEASAAKSITFIENNHSYVVCYNYGQDLVKKFIESNGGTAENPQRKWELFGWLLSNPVGPGQLVTRSN